MSPEPEINNTSPTVEAKDDVKTELEVQAPGTQTPEPESKPETDQTKRVVPWKNVARTAGCIALGIFGCLSISTRVGFGWVLQERWQIVVLGLAITVMSQFLAQDVVTKAFLLYEYRNGQKRDAYRTILTQSFLGPSKRWRPALGVWAAIPAVLSIGYKQFLGGEASARWTPSMDDSVRTYGVDFPRIGAWSPPNDSIYLLLTSFSAFQTASDYGYAPYPSTFPRAYGYNTLLLSNDSAAILDIPTGSYMVALQKELGQKERFVITAEVDAYVATRNASSDSFVTDDTLWNATYENNNGEFGLSTMSLYTGEPEALGIMPFGEPSFRNNNRLFISMYGNSTFGRGLRFYSDPDDGETVPFRRSAQLYNIDRQTCRGRWELNATSILLTEGSCDGTRADLDVLEQLAVDPFPYDILPALVHTYEHLPRPEGEETPWLHPTYSVSAATMYWARALYMFVRRGPFEAYAPRREEIHWVRPTLRDHPALYVILSVIPAVALVALGYELWVGKLPPGEKPWDDDEVLREELNEVMQ